MLLLIGPWQVTQGLHANSRDILMTYWQHILDHLENDAHDYKTHQLPLARIKKVMKADPDVKMISAEAPILFAKGCDVFITELTMRAWIHAEENKRRTLQRSDIASALAKSDMFDFLIDIVPREDATGHSKKAMGSGAGSSSTQTTGSQQSGMPPQHPDAQVSPHGMSGYGMPTEQAYRPPPNIYGPPGSEQNPGYGQGPGQFMPEMYGYPGMNPPQVSLSIYG